MKDGTNLTDYEVGYNIPAAIGMDEADIQTPCLILDLDALERNIIKMGQFAKDMGVRHRVHGKMHKSVDVALLQEKLGGSCGVCCQKVSEAEAFVRGGIKDVLVSNQVRDPAKIDRLARIPNLGARTVVCVDDVENVADLSAAAEKHGTTIECIIEIDCGAGRCGVTTTDAVMEIARAIDAVDGLKFSGIQAYQGAMQHMDSYDDRKAKIDLAVAMVRHAVDALPRRVPRVWNAISSAAAALEAIILRATPAFTTSCNAGPTPSWTPITAASSTRTATALTKGSGKTLCSS